MDRYLWNCSLLMFSFDSILFKRCAFIVRRSGRQKKKKQKKNTNDPKHSGHHHWRCVHIVNATKTKVIKMCKKFIVIYVNTHIQRPASIVWTPMAEHRLWLEKNKINAHITRETKQIVVVKMQLLSLVQFLYHLVLPIPVEYKR